jgi:hypothetical protein
MIVPAETLAESRAETPAATLSGRVDARRESQ